jgi:hypothetical protein
VPRGEPPLLDVWCPVDPSAPLRATCRLVLTEPLPVEIEVTDGIETAVFATVGGELEPVVPVWGLTSDTAWSYVARVGEVELGGTIETGSLGEATTVEVHTTGVAAAVVQVLAPVDCVGGGHATVLDAAGRVRWFADTGGEDVDLVQWTEDGTVLWIADRTQVTEVDASGRVVFGRDDLELPLHHDVFRRGERVYTLQADVWPAADGVTYVEDVVVAYDRTGDEVWRWDTHDHLDATLSSRSGDPYWRAWFPGAIDAWHTNGLFVTEDGELVLSVNAEDSVLAVSVVDGAQRWSVAGGGTSAAIPPTYGLALGPRLGDPTFGDQHHAALLPGGHLTVFDNPRNRALELALDATTGTAKFEAEWLVGLDCPIQSSVFSLDGGGRLVTCGDAHTFVEFDPAGHEVGRHVLSCPNGAVPPRTTRGQPLDLWDGVTAAGVTATRVW